MTIVGSVPENPPRSNRGPAAAPENRRAILAAARRLFAERGYHVPLSAIAREAGVGQGVLYRHFPTRLDLAHTVFEENFARLEALARAPEDAAFGALWRCVVDLIVDEVAFVEMAVDARRSQEGYDGEQRLSRLLGPLLERARRAGLVPATVTLADLALVQRMVYGVVVTAVDGSEARPAVERLLEMVGLDGVRDGGAPAGAEPAAARR